MTVSVVAQHARVPLASVTLTAAQAQEFLSRGGKLTVLIEREWLRTLTDLATAANEGVTNANPLTADQLVVGDGLNAIKTLPAGANGYVATMVAGIPAWAPGGGSLTVEEVDGTPTVSATKLVLPNGSLGVVGTVATYTPTAVSAGITRGKVQGLLQLPTNS